MAHLVGAQHRRGQLAELTYRTQSAILLALDQAGVPRRGRSAYARVLRAGDDCGDCCPPPRTSSPERGEAGLVSSRPVLQDWYDMTVTEIPAGLRGPVEVALAKSAERIPGAQTLGGAAMYEPKWDGFRSVLVRDTSGTHLWSRQGKDLTDRFPDMAAVATAQVTPGTVLDGELVIWNGDRLDFDLLQQRLVNPAKRAGTLASRRPATYMAFDVLGYDWEDLRSQPLRTRRLTLEHLSQRWAPPLQVSPVTTDEGTAGAWIVDYRPAGIEGIVAKAADGPYRPGRRDWVKVKSRETQEVIIGAVTGPIARPDTVVAGLLRGGDLVIVGKSVPLSRSQAASLATVLEPGPPQHPWPDEVSSSRFGSSRDKVRLTKVEPNIVAEVLADSALHAGVWRHPLRFVRHRPDLTPADLPTLDP